jgi:hypothetical protein
MQEHTPSEQFQFPNDARDKIEEQLRAVTAEREPLRSVRPERQRTPDVVVTPSLPEFREAPKPPPQLPPGVASVNVVSNATTPMSDPEGISIELPSKFFYYPFKDLYVKPFRLSHLAKVAKAHETASMQTLTEVVSSVLSTPGGHKNIGFMLTNADFNAVLYWLRLNSFGKRQMRVTHTCVDSNHIAMVESGVRTKESLNISTLYTESDMKMVMLDKAPDPEHYSIDIEGVGKVYLRPETVSDVIQFMDHPDWQDSEFQYNARIASVLSVNHADGSAYSLTDKIALLDRLTADQGVLALEFAEIVDVYGVVETVQTKCIGCGASPAVKIAVDALSFLSPEF